MRRSALLLLPVPRRLRSAALLLAVVIGLTSCSDTTPVDGTAESSNAPAEPSPPPPNVVLVLIDTLRADHLDLYGYDRETAPYLARLAERAAVFPRAYSTSSWTAPSTASLFTGLYPTRHGLTRGFFAQNSQEDAVEAGEETHLALNALPADLPLLTEYLQAAGYNTFGYAANINVGETLGFSRGFDHFEHKRKQDAARIRNHVLTWKRQMDAAPSFLYLHLNDVHQPYNARTPWYRSRRNKLQDEIARYDSEISFVDRTLSQLHDDLGWDDNTLVWIVSDHGEEFMDHGTTGHRFSLYQELMRVVMLVHGPDLGVQARSVPFNTSLIDVLPTLLDLLGEAPLEGRDGRSLAPLLRGSNASEATKSFGERVLFGHRKKRDEETQMWAAVLDTWKMIQREDDGTTHLFDLANDPKETRNVAENHPELVALLGTALDALKAQSSEGGGAVSVRMDDEMLAELKRLGYVEDDRP